MSQQNQATGKLKHSEKVFSATPIPHDQAPAAGFDRAVTADRFGQHKGVYRDESGGITSA
jgi:hypothetical protein